MNHSDRRGARGSSSAAHVWPKFLVLSAVALIITAALATLAVDTTPAEVTYPPPAEASYALAPMSLDEEADECSACHSDVTDGFGRNVHASVDERWASRNEHVGSCSACHGDASAHLDEGGGAENIFSYGPDRGAVEKRDACMTCHSESHPRFAMSHHAKGNMDCTSCHSVHGEAHGEGGVQSVSETCRDCHTQEFASFNFTQHHRIQEGAMECTSCHDPHEPSNRVQLAGFKQESCADCHTDKHGPYVFEHAAQRIEGCTSCHEPHGSPNRHMLKFQSQAEMCYSCHNNIPGFHTRFVPPSTGSVSTQCTNCHSAIHGSNFNEYFLR